MTPFHAVAAEVAGYDPVQAGGVVAFALAVLGILRRFLSKQDKREAAEHEARGKREERSVAAAEKMAEATSAGAKANAELATSISAIASEVRELAGEMREIRNDITPLLTPSRTGPSGPHSRRGPGGREG